MMDHYKEAFERAISATQRHGLAVPGTHFEDGRLMDAERLQRLTVVATRIFKVLSLEDIQAQSLIIHQELGPIVEKVFDTPAFYTFGSVRLPPEDYFELTDGTISEILKEGQGEKDLELHAWLTLPTIELIDFSINTTLAAALHSPEIASRVLAAHPSQFKGGLAFHPVLVGEDLLNRLGAKADSPDR